MKLTGVAKFKKPVEEIWKALHDPKILSNAIPGCQSLTLQEGGEYEVLLKLGIAAVKGEYTGKVTLDDIEEPTHYVLTAEGSGNPGHVKADMDCKLIPTAEGCELHWDLDAEIGGKIASVGDRVMGGLAKFMASKFFKDIEKQL